MTAYCRARTIVGVIAVATAMGAMAPRPVAAQAAEGPVTTRELREFGPLTTPGEVKAAYEKAKAEMLAEGGVLLVPAAANRLYREENTSQVSDRNPPAPAETKRWTRSGPGITVVVAGDDGAVVQAPSIDGLNIQRTLRMPIGDSLPHWSTDAAVKIDNKLIHGANSYLDWLAEDVQAGKDARFYVRTIRGLRPGMFLNLHGGPGYGGGVTRGCIKTLGYDAAKKKHFFAADTEINHLASAIVHNKNNEGVIWMKQEANCDEQTYDIMLNRWQYALGDTYMFFGRYRYMSNIHSAAGDENGNIFGAYTESLANNFVGVVEAVDWTSNTVTFAGADARNVETLGTSRTLVNLNPKKHITQGKVIVVPAESYWDTIDTGKYPFEGRTYPTIVTNGGLRMGGLIRGDKDCPWDTSIIGRYFGITEPTELIPRASKIRWYEVARLTVNADGTKDITIQRFWWGAKTMNSPTLYRTENGTWDGHVRPLSYVIAPGTYVTDVTRALGGDGVPRERILGVVPYCDAGTPFDFETGDAIEQAVGPDPFKPTPFRMWMWDNVPTVFPSPVFDINNGGCDPRYAALWVRGGPSALEGLVNTPRQRPAWENVVVMGSAADVGINCQADFANAAILFQQPNRDQPIKWHYGERVPGKPVPAATLTVSRENGDLTFDGGDARFSGSLVARGLSAEGTPARNLRGKNVAVEAAAARIEVAFPVEEADADYAVFVEQSWLGNRAIVAKDTTGFTVQFEKPAPEAGKLDWMIVR